MKTKKNKLAQLFLLLLMIQSVVNLQAQVRMGGSVTPNPNAVLDLNANDTISGSRGLLLPRVALISTATANPLMEHVAGMLVFNTATSGDVSPGVYYNDGTKWVRGTGGAVVEPPVSNIRETKIDINESINLQSVLYYGEITDIGPNTTVLGIRGVFSDPSVVSTSFTVTPLLKLSDDGTTILWSLQVQNFNIDPEVSCNLEKIIVIYECFDDEDLTITFSGVLDLVGW